MKKLLTVLLMLFCMPALSEETVMKSYDFSLFTNVTLSGIDSEILKEEELAVLYQAARYCQAMTEADIETMRQIVSEDMRFTHMSGKTQSREEYFADVASGRLSYYTIGMEDIVLELDGDTATVTYTAALNANAYGARGTFRIRGAHRYQMRGGVWIAVNR